MKRYITLALSLTCVALSQVSGEEIIFQNGLNGYKGTRQALLQGDIEVRKIENLSNRDSIRVVGVSWGGARRLALLRFDDIFDSEKNGFPEGAEIISARLELYKTGENVDTELLDQLSDPQRVVSVYRMLSPFYETNEDGSYSCFSYRAYGGNAEEYWGNENKITEGPVRDEDYDPAPIGAIPIETEVFNQWYTVDVTNVVRDWQNGDPNHGFFLSAHSYWIGLWFASTNYSEESQRPRLVIEFQK